MMRPLVRPNGRRVFVWTLWVSVAFLSAVRSASSAILENQAIVSTTVQELIDGSPGSVNSDADQTSPEGTGFPIDATASLDSTDLSGALVASARGFSAVLDPTRLEQPNPEEFALEVAGYSNAETIAYTVDGNATESRTVIFTTAGNPLANPEITFGADGVRTVESRVFLSGAVVAWSVGESDSLAGLTADLEVTVTQDGDGEMFRSRLLVTGEADGSVDFDTTGAIQVQRISLEDLADQGLDAASLAILQQVEDTGQLVILAIPEQEHTYQYDVTADVTTVLTADFTAVLENAPGGTGISAVWGRPFENLADFIGQAISGVDGADLQRAINAETAARRIGPVPAVIGGNEGPLAGLCGALGIETAGLTFALALAAFLRTKK